MRPPPGRTLLVLFLVAGGCGFDRSGAAGPPDGVAGDPDAPLPDRDGDGIPDAIDNCRYGFRPLARYFSWDLTAQHLALMGQMAGFARKAFEDKALADGYRFRTLDVSRFEEEFAAFFALMAEAFAKNLGHVPLSFEEFAFARAGARDELDPELIIVVEGPDGSRIGASYVYPDRVSGRVILHTMFSKKEHRKRGLVEIGFGILSETLARKGFDSAIGALAREGPTFYDKTGPASREYTLFAIGA